MRITIEQIKNYPVELSLELVTEYRFEISGPAHIILNELELSNRAFLVPNKKVARHVIGQSLYSDDDLFNRNIVEMVTTLQDDGDFEFGLETDTVIIVELIAKFLQSQKILHANRGTRPTQDQLYDYDYLVKLMDKAQAIVDDLTSRGHVVEEVELPDDYDVGPFGGFLNLESSEKVMGVKPKFVNPFERE